MGTARRVTLVPGQVLRGIFHCNAHGPGMADPTSSIEQFASVEEAEDIFARRARTGSSDFCPAAAPGTRLRTDWPDTDDTAYMDVWVEEGQADEEEPGIPGDMCQRWTWKARRIRRTPF